MRLSREQLVCLALERNDQIEASQARLRQARAGYAEASAAYFYPHIELQGDLSGPIRPARGNAVEVTPESRLDRFTFEDSGILIRGELSILYPFYTFGRLSAARDGAAAFVDAASANVKIQARDVALDVQKAAEAIVFSRKILTILDEAGGRLDSALKTVQRELDAGNLDFSEIDRDRLLAAKAEIRGRRTQSKQLKSSSEAALVALIDWDAERPPHVAEQELDLPPLPEDLESEVTPELAEQQPEVKAARATARARAHLVKEAQSAAYPTFFVVGGARGGFSNAADDQLSPFAYDPYNYYEGGFALGARADLDIALQHARAERAVAEAQQAALESQAARAGIVAKIRTVAVTLARSYERAEILRESIQHAKRWAIAETLDFTAGVGKTSDLVDALAFFYLTELQRLESTFLARQAWHQYQRFLNRDPGVQCKTVKPRLTQAITAPVLPASERPNALFATASTTSRRQPSEILRDNIEALEKAVARDREKLARKQAVALIDFDTFAKNTLERQWPDLTATQRREFTQAFSDVIARNYVNRIQQAESFEVEITGEERTPEGVWLETVAEAAGTTIRTDYLFSDASGNWAIIDIRVEGLSLTQRYSRSFSRVIRDEGFEGLLSRLGDKSRSL